MSYAMTRVGGNGREHGRLAWAGLLAGLAACSSQPAAPSQDSRTAAQLALTKADLPACTSTHEGEAYYVWNESVFYVCKSSTRTWVQTILNGVNGAARVTTIAPGSQ